MRQYIKSRLSIDGRVIPYRLITAKDYFEAKELPDEKIDEYVESGIYTLVNQIMAISNSIYLLRRTAPSCGSLSHDMGTLKCRLIDELKEKHNYEFDEEFYESYGMEMYTDIEY